MYKINLGTYEEPQEARIDINGLVLELMKIIKYLINSNSFQLLSLTKQPSKLTFLIKIIGRQKDYYIAEQVVANSQVEDGELPSDVEPRGSGVNTQSYWACTDILNDKDLVELLLITPQQINASRQIKYMFTGNLEADVITNPYFSGKENILLKAQIVRITQSTVIISKGQFILREEDPKELDPASEYKLPLFHNLKTLNDWMHFNQNILYIFISVVDEFIQQHVEPEAYQKQQKQLIHLKIEQNKYQMINYQIIKLFGKQEQLEIQLIIILQLKILILKVIMVLILLNLYFGQDQYCLFCKSFNESILLFWFQSSNQSFLSQITIISINRITRYSGITRIQFPS